MYLYDEKDQVQFTSRHQEKMLRPEDKHENFIHAFNAYSPAGDASGELVSPAELLAHSSVVACRCT